MVCVVEASTHSATVALEEAGDIAPALQLLNGFLSCPDPDSSKVTAVGTLLRCISHLASRLELDGELLKTAKAAINKVAAASDASIVSELVVAGRGGDYERVGSFMLVTAVWKALIGLVEHCNGREAGAIIGGLAGEVARLVRMVIEGTKGARDCVVKLKVAEFLAKGVARVTRVLIKLSITLESGVSRELIEACALTMTSVQFLRLPEAITDRIENGVLPPLCISLRNMLCLCDIGSELQSVQIRQRVSDPAENLLYVGLALVVIYLVRVCMLGVSRAIKRSSQNEPVNDPSFSALVEKLNPFLASCLLANLFQTVAIADSAALDFRTSNGISLFEVVCACASELVLSMDSKQRPYPTKKLDIVLFTELLSCNSVRGHVAMNVIRELAKKRSVRRRKLLLRSLLSLTQVSISCDSVAAESRLIPLSAWLGSSLLAEGRICLDDLVLPRNETTNIYEDPALLRVLSQMLYLQQPGKSIAMTMSSCGIDRSSLALFVKTALSGNASCGRIAESAVHLLPLLLDSRLVAGATLAIAKHPFISPPLITALLEALSPETVPTATLILLSREARSGCRRYGPTFYAAVVDFIAKVTGHPNASVSEAIWQDLSEALEIILVEINSLIATSPSVAVAVLQHAGRVYRNISNTVHCGKVTHLEFPKGGRHAVEAVLSRSLAFEKDPECLRCAEDESGRFFMLRPEIEERNAANPAYAMGEIRASMAILTEAVLAVESQQERKSLLSEVNAFRKAACSLSTLLEQKSSSRIEHVDQKNHTRKEQ